jgi:hypothetical protein
MRPTQGERFYHLEEEECFPFTLSRRRPLRRRIEGCPLGTTGLRRLRHTTRCGQKLTIHYPFHPYCGKSVQVVFDGGTGAGDSLTVVGPDGDRRKIPRWMFESVAAAMRIEAEAVIGVAALLRIAELLEVRAPSPHGVARATVPSAGQGSEKGGGGEATPLEDGAGGGAAAQRTGRKRTGPLDGQRRGGSGERRER